MAIIPDQNAPTIKPNEVKSVMLLQFVWECIVLIVPWFDIYFPLWNYLKQE